MRRTCLGLGAALAAVAVGALNIGAAVADNPNPTGPRLPPIVHRGAHLPPPAQAGAVPLLIVLHGSSMWPAEMESVTGYDKLADRDGFVVAYLGSQTPTRSAWTRINMPVNLQYISQEIQSLTASENIDPRRVYVAGFSAGATMALYVGCGLSRQVAAVGAVSGWMNRGLPCTPVRPVSTFVIMGTNDAAPWNGNAKLLGASSIASYWGGFDGCTLSTDATAGAVETWRWSNCNDGTTNVGEVISGGTHQWPNPWAGPGDNQVDATSALWSFFTSHPSASATQVSASVSAVTVLRVGRRRWVRLSADALEGSVVVRVGILRFGHRLVYRVLHLPRARSTSRISIPAFAPAGRYLVRLSFADRYGRTLTLTRRLTVPKA